MKVGLTVHLIARYMDDGRSFLPPLKAGWRWKEGRLLYCVKWEQEDKVLSPTERTKRALGQSMREILSFLDFTTESGEDYEDGWLPTLDSSLKVDKDNSVLFRFWEQPTNTNLVVQLRTAMSENQKTQILTADMIRRLANSSDSLEDEDYSSMVDRYAQKLVNSGYGIGQTRRIISAGIKGWRNKVNRCKKEGLRLRRTAAESQGQRLKDKLLGKSSWFRKTKTKEQDKLGSRNKGKRGAIKDNKGGGAEVQARTVLFVEQTPGGELAARELLTRLEPLLDFKVKVTERWGRNIQSHFPLNNQVWQRGLHYL